MSGLIQTDFISETAYGGNLAYVLMDNNIFLPTEYKVLQSHKDGCFIKCMKLLYNGRIQLFYLTNGYQSLMNLLHSIEAEGFITIVANLFADVIAVKNNGFLTCQNIDITPEHIFVDMATYKIGLVYLPINKRLHCDMPQFENELRISLTKFIQGIPSLSAPKTMQLAADLSNGMLSLEQLLSKLQGRTILGKNISSEFAQKESMNDGTMKLVAMNAPMPLEILITKDEFMLGRKQELVDGLISFNKMIGRVHCKIVRQGNQYAIIDLKSANGTYVNKIRIQPEQPCPIKAGDIVRLANSEFQVILG